MYTLYIYICVCVCVSHTHNSSEKQFILHLPFASLEKIPNPGPSPSPPARPSARLCRKQGPLEVQTLITELRYFSKLQGMAPGEERKAGGEQGAGRRRGEPLRPGLQGRVWRLGRARPRPLGRAPHPQPVRPGAPCRQRRVKARGRAAGSPWGRGGAGGPLSAALSRV